MVYDCDEYFFFLQEFFLDTRSNSHNNLWNAQMVLNKGKTKPSMSVK